MIETPAFHDLQDPLAALRPVARLAAAALAGAVIGFQREYRHKAAGLRTHTLVAAGVALMVILGEAAGLQGDAISRVIQGIATGVGFIGTGTILKLEGEQQIQGVTTAASLWVTTAIGVGYGLGYLWLPSVVAISVVLILTFFGLAERRMRRASR